MLEFIILMVILDLLMKIPVGEVTYIEPKPSRNEWEFDNLDDAMEYHEMRQSGWRGDIHDYYRWKADE